MSGKHVMAVIPRTDGSFLYEVRATGSCRGLLMFPGGGVEKGETPEEAVVREMQEELGIRLVGFRRIETNRTPKTNSGKRIVTFFVESYLGNPPSFNADDQSPIVWGTREHARRHFLESMQLIGSVL